VADWPGRVAAHRGAPPCRGRSNCRRAPRSRAMSRYPGILESWKKPLIFCRLVGRAAVLVEPTPALAAACRWKPDELPPDAVCEAGRAE